MNGLALLEYGLEGALSFDFFALLLVVMGMTSGVLALAIARSMRRHFADEWFFGLAAESSVGFALAFLALANRWIQLERRPFHPSAFLWVCLYFGLSAVWMLGLGLRLRRRGPSESGSWEALPPLGNPNHAH